MPWGIRASGLFAAILITVLIAFPVAWALAVHFAPVPYNAFLLRSLWRTPGKPGWTLAGAGAWFAGMLVV